MRIFNALKKILKRYFLLGLFVLLPFYITLKFFMLVFGFFESILRIDNGTFLYIIPADFHPNYLLGYKVPGLDIVITILFVILVGILSRNYFGHTLIRIGDRIIDQIPLARSIHRVAKEVLKNFTAEEHYNQYKRVILIEYPRKGLYTMAFVTSDQQKYFSQVTGKKLLNVFVPTSPNPTSGYLILVPEDETIPTNFGIEAAFKLVISGGMVNVDYENPEVL
ncbi:DUF502 domain-containing protein [bacterium]|nr:DUF502 domain-containing protein [bacterium]